MKEKRYVIGLQDSKDTCCFKDSGETDKRGEAERIADDLAVQHNRPAIVYERHVGIVYRTSEQEPRRPEPFKSKRKRT